MLTFQRNQTIKRGRGPMILRRDWIFQPALVNGRSSLAPTIADSFTNINTPELLGQGIRICRAYVEFSAINLNST